MYRVAWAALLSAAAFAGSFGLHPFYDDWVVPSHAATALATGTVGEFLASFTGYHWSPAWNLAALINVRFAGLHDDILIRSFTLAVYLASLFWFARLAPAFGASGPAVTVALGVLGLHHVRAAALYSFDTYSQVAVDLASWVSAGMAYLALIGGAGPRDARLVWAVAIALLALLMKEQALAGVACLLGLTVWAWWSAREPADRRRALVLATVLALGTLAFAAARHAAGARFDDAGVHALCLSCIPANMGLLAAAVVLPFRTLWVVDAWRAMPHDAIALVVAGGAAAVLVAGVASGCRRQWSAGGRRQVGVALCFFFFLLAGVPVVALGRVGELHAHTLVFWFAMLVAIAATHWQRALATVWQRGMAAVVCIAYLASLGTGLRANLGDMRETGARAGLWRARFESAARDLPPGSTVLVGGQPERAPGDYSLYRMTSPEDLVLLWLWGTQPPDGGGPEIALESSAFDRARLAGAGARGPVFELQRSEQGLWFVRTAYR